MNFRQTATHFLQNVADHLQEDNAPIEVPDYMTGQPHQIVDRDKQKAYRDLVQHTAKHMPNHVVIMREEDGEFIPMASPKDAVPYLFNPPRNEPMFQ